MRDFIESKSAPHQEAPWEEKNIWKVASRIMLTIFLIAYLLFATLGYSGPIGESASFMLSTVSLCNHGSFSITEQDYNDAVAAFPGYEEHFRWQYYNFLTQDSSGNRYPFYFGLYVFLCIPLFKILPGFGVAPAYDYHNIPEALY